PEIVEMGAVAPLVVLLRGEDPECRKRAAIALRNLAAAGPELKAAVAEAGAAEPLVDMLGCSDVMSKAAACAALRQLASDRSAQGTLLAPGAVK
ncbi:unnamed protein product, partial [Polarella glacialis]